MPSRRQLLVGCSSVAISSLAGCLGDSDTDSDESNTDDSEEVVDHPAPPDPGEHPDFDGVAKGGIGGPLLTWITAASNADSALDVIGNPTGEPTQYIDETDFDEYGVLVYNESMMSTCDMVDIPTTTIENGRLYAEASSERRDPCDGKLTFIAYMLRVPVEDPPAEALLERGTARDSVSNRYRVDVEEITRSPDEFRNRIIEEAELTEPVLEELRSAIDEPFERYNPPALITTYPQRYSDVLRVDDTLYLPSVTDVLGSSAKEWTTVLRDEYGNEVEP